MLPPPSAANCDCGTGGDSVQTADGANGGNPPHNASSDGVRAGDGTVKMGASDLSSAGFGTPWGQTRSWTNHPGYRSNGFNGSGIVDNYQPYLLQGDNGTIVQVSNGSTARYFDLVNSVYQARHFEQSKLVFVGGEFVLTDSTGNSLRFYSFDLSLPVYQRGQLKRFTDPYGVDTTVNRFGASDPQAGKVSSVSRTTSFGGTLITESYLDSYYPSGQQVAGMLSTVVLQRQVSGQMPFTVRQVQYTYYDGVPVTGVPSYGNASNLKTVTVMDGAGQVIDQSYYRWYRPDDIDAANGYRNGLKMMFGPQSFARLMAAFPNLPTRWDTATDDQVLPYADSKYLYNPDHRVKQHIVQGAGSSTSTGQGTFTYDYFDHPNTAGYNVWFARTTETLPDNSQYITYTNYAGQVMLQVFQGQFMNFYQYDDSLTNTGRLQLHALPSAVIGYSETYPDLLLNIGGNYQFLYNTSGLIEKTVYQSLGVSDPRTGYFKESSLQFGQTGTAIPQRTVNYTTQAAGGVTVVVPSDETVYRDDLNRGNPRMTQYTYGWYTGTTRMQSRTITKPMISYGQNGPGTSDVEITSFDTAGRAISTMDGGGFVNSTVYDPATGAPIEIHRDLNGLNLTSTMVVDWLGRETKRTDPVGNVTYTVYRDAQHEVRTYPGWQGAPINGPTGPTQVTREEGSFSTTYTENLTMTATPTLNGDLTPKGDEPLSGIQTLSRSYTSPGGQDLRMDAYFNLTGLPYSIALYFGAAGAVDPNGNVSGNYWSTQFRYDGRGRQYYTIAPTGTITRTDYDELGRSIAVWTGTTDANLVEIRENVYDAYNTSVSGFGDSNLTQVTEFPGGAGVPNRVTQYYYDWRDRQVASKRGVGNPQSSEDTTTHRPIVLSTYDNLNEVIQTDQYDGDRVVVSYSNGVPIVDPVQYPNKLRAHTSTSYDDQGRVYNSQDYFVDQMSGLIGFSLVTNTWYDRRGQVIKKLAPGAPVEKTHYDGAGRNDKSYTTDGRNDTIGQPDSWTRAGNVTENNVLNQTETTYDVDDNAIFVLTRERFHNANPTGTVFGDLQTPTQEPRARVSYVANYFDALNRLTTSVNAGTNGGLLYTRPVPPPGRFDTPALVTSYAYGPAGWVQDVTDPRGLVTHTEYDNLGRTIKTVDAYSNPPTTSNRTTLYGYDGDTQMVTLTAVLPAGVQTTQYVYSVSTSIISSYDLLSLIKHPDKNSGAPSTLPADQESYSYDALGETIGKTDQNGTAHSITFDVLGRQTADAATPGTGVDTQIKRLETAYDTLGRAFLFTSYNMTTGGTVRNQVRRDYNNIGQLVREYQEHGTVVNPATTPKVQYTYSETLNGTANHSRLTAIVYPNTPTPRTLTYNYSGMDDTISRLSYLSDSTTPNIEGYSYLGLNAVVVRSHPQSTDLTYVNQPNGSTDGGDQYTGLDRFGRVIDQLWGPTGSPSDRFQYGYDRNGNRLYRANLASGATAFSELYHLDGPANGYDDLNQLLAFARGTLNPSKDSIVEITRHNQRWTLDIMGNWSTVTTDGVDQNRMHNKQNELTNVGANTLGFDNNGNTTMDENGKTLAYDAWNRLVRYNGTTTFTYAYDALDRRITGTSLGTGSSTLDYYYSKDWQVVEERNSGATSAQYVWSPAYVDALVERDVGSQRMYVQQDANWNVTAIVDTSANVQERYIYDPYGRFTDTAGVSTAVLTPNWTTRGASAYNWVYLHQGGRYENGLYNFRHRDYSPTLGRWMQQDPVTYRDGMNLYKYVANSPTNASDPSGFWRFVSGMGTLKGSLRPTKASDDYGPASSEFQLEFRPDQKAFASNANNTCCAQIRFVQIYYLDAKLIVRSPLDLPDRTWAIDSDSPPFYPFGTWRNPSNPNAFVSTMHDSPYFKSLGKRARPSGISADFEVCAVCSKSKSGTGGVGDVFACVKWGHSFQIAGTIFNAHVTDTKRYVGRTIEQNFMKTINFSETADAPSAEMKKKLRQYFPST